MEDKIMKKTKKLDYYMNLNYPLQITKVAEDEGGGYLAEIPLLKGCMSDGESTDEAIENVTEAKKEWLEYMLDNDLEITEPKTEDEYSGKFTVRISKSLHRIIAEQSKREGLSINQYVANSLAYIAGTKSIYRHG